ncbi:hypothetical protein [Lentzea sp. NPDC051838]|uniref:hypothetical protein n=1 Tax=Lentzea sp. NPDC051838 TaxID=3154849 RepID=UPI00343827AD
MKHPGFDDPHEPERWASKLHLDQEIFLTRTPEVAQLPAATRLANRLIAKSTYLSRRGTVVLRYRF